MIRCISTLGTTGLVAFAATVGLNAQEHALDAGPLLAFTVVQTNDSKRQNILRVAELEGSGNFELYHGKHGARVLRRLDRDHLLLELPDPKRLVAFDVPRGVGRELVRGSCKFTSVRDGDVLFLAGPGRTGKLHSVSWREEATPVVLCDHAFSRVPLLVGNLAFAVDQHEQSVWIISLASGRSRQVWTAPGGHSRVRIALSPNGQRLAVGLIDKLHRGRLEVVDAATGESIQTWKDLPIWVSPLSSSIPTLEVAFADDENVICSETRGNRRGIHGQFVHVTRSLATGEIEDEAVYSGLDLDHKPPAPTPPEPSFEITRSKKHAELRRTGSSDVLAQIPRSRQQYEDLAVSRPDGRYATARLGDKRERLTLFPPTGKPRQLSTTWAHSLTWLPAVR